MPSSAEKVLSNIREDEVVRILQELIRTKCEPDAGIYERDIAEYASKRLRDMGIGVELVEKEAGRPSVLARMKGSGGGHSIMFNGHQHAAVTRLEDWTVSPYEGVVKDGKVYGVAAADMKASNAAKIAALGAIKEAGVRHKGDIILFFGSGGEKAGRIGTKYVVEERGVRADFGVVGEPSDLQVVVAERGAIWFEVVTKGVEGLSGVSGVNAIEKMSNVIQGLKAYGSELAKHVDPLLGSATVSVNMVEAGSAPYTVPARCRAVVDRRLVLSETVDQGLREMQQILGDLRRADPQLDVEAKPLFTIDPVSVGQDEPIVKTALDAFRQIGRSTKIGGFKGWTEAYHMIRAGIPTVICGPGKVEVVHAPDEHVSVKDLVDTARVYALMALSTAGVA